ncbi:MAG: hypothetical protein WKG07_35920 [Hymenobacter sp.]
MGTGTTWTYCPPPSPPATWPTSSSPCTPTAAPTPECGGFKAPTAPDVAPTKGSWCRPSSRSTAGPRACSVDPIVSRNMRGYYAFSWSRFQASVAPHTPAPS